jgi:hypothetical protein
MKIKKTFGCQVIIVIFILLMASNYTFPYICSNGSGLGFGVGITGPSTLAETGTSTSIEGYVVKGACNFLDYCLDMDVYSKLVEESYSAEMDIFESVKTLDSAITKIQAAVATYETLIKQAENTPYNMVVISKLMTFDYAGYLKTNGLNAVVFSRVESYLKRGDIVGVYKFTNIQFKAIRDLLYKAKSGADTALIPDIQTLWKLNELTAETRLFGQYVSRVFSVIK